MLILIKIYSILILILLYNSNSVCMLECATSYLYNEVPAHSDPSRGENKKK